MQRTNIPYITHSWNPIAMRCTPVSVGCRNCWHIKMAKRLAANPALSARVRAAYRGEGNVALREHELTAPLRLRKPARIGVQFMGDLFHEAVPDEFIEYVFIHMGLAAHHTFFVLTKRPERMLALLTKHVFLDYVPGTFMQFERLNKQGKQTMNLPFKNIYLGVSVEDQKTVDERIPLLLQTPAAVRFVSYEPALGPVDFTRLKKWTLERTTWNDALNGTVDGFSHKVGGGISHVDGKTKTDWIIMGGESGPGARPMHPDWARSVRDQCQAAGVAFWFKQWGEWRQVPTDTWGNFDRVGLKRAGRLLDGKEYNEVPR